MSKWLEDNPRVLRLGILGLTILFAAIVLTVGYQDDNDVPPELAVGAPAPQDFVANASVDIEDPTATEEERDLAEANVKAPYVENRSTSQVVLRAIGQFYSDLDEGAFLEPDEPLEVTVPDFIGSLFADAQEDARDVGLIGQFADTIDTDDVDDDGRVAQQLPSAGKTVDEGSTVNLFVYVWSGSTTTTVPPTTTTTVPEAPETERRPVEEQVEELMQKHAPVGRDIIANFVTLHESDLDRIQEGEPSVFPDMQDTSISWAEDELTAGIRSAIALNDVKTKYLLPEQRPPMSIVGIPEEDFDTTHEAVANLVAARLAVNEQIDPVLWDTQKETARAEVPDQYVTYAFGEKIAVEGDTLTSIQVQAITELNLYEPEVALVAPRWALALFGALSILIFAFLVLRIAPSNADRTKDQILLAIILGLAALISRVPGFVTSVDNHSIGYVIPAVAIGMMAAILFDQRIGLLVAVPMAAFVAIATSDITFTVYAGIAAAVPVAFVSSVSTRSQLRLSVLGSAAVVAPVAAALEFLFHFGAEDGSPWLALVWAFGGAVLGGFLAQGLVSFLESAFGVTTAMSLLDLLDRNHPALQLLEQQAPGTFNHSMLVGSIAGKAARAVGADPLLAQAAAWYHDLGKTENPQFFVENQLGYNPHDELRPEESAEIIRSHVTDGLALAAQYRIPEEVANGIRMHHGTSLMRYFYHKALAEDPDTDPEVFRHHGQKPTRSEMAIVMIADATEAAARAYAQKEQPTEEGLSKLVDSIVSEKLDDGQFDESSLTFGQLTTIKTEVVAALSAYYHARVEYPDFPEVQPAEGS
jgi:putative nucleotidyltransferase with HDIG domain